jgi:hypothetical protein
LSNRHRGRTAPRFSCPDPGTIRSIAALVVFGSIYGNTGQVAEAIVEGLRRAGEAEARGIARRLRRRGYELVPDPGELPG